MIEIKNISKSFGEKVVLRDVSATLMPGKTNLIIGTSGSGIMTNNLAHAHYTALFKSISKILWPKKS